MLRELSSLKVWQRAVELSVQLYEISRRWPQNEQYGLTSQIRRAAVSVASNIAEGYGRGTPGDQGRFMRIARGSLYEVHTQLTLAIRLNYLSEHEFNVLSRQVSQIQRMLDGYIHFIASHRA